MNMPGIYTSTASSRSWRKRSACRCLREDRAGESEFVTISYWESVAAMSRFAGDDPRRIHHLERDAEFLIELRSEVQILDIVASHGTTGDPSP
jgi:heme-degrading monooxygenase HmoA